MKSVLKISCLAAVILAAVGCQEKESEVKTTAKVPVVQTEQSAQLATDDDKIAYALGTSMARYLIENAANQEGIGVTLNKDVMLTGIQDTFAGQIKLSDDETQKVLMTFQERVNTAMQAEQKKKAEELLAKAKVTESEGKAYRDNYAKEEGVITTKSGLMYKVLQQGKGAKPKATDKVKVHYEGKLIDGTVFDSSYERKEPITFPLDGVIPGWTEGLQLVNKGSIVELVIPPQLAYGMRDSSTIPANSTLVFKVELLDINPKDTTAPQKSAQPKGQ